MKCELCQEQEATENLGVEVKNRTYKKWREDKKN